MKKPKKILAAILTISMLASLSACDSKHENVEDDNLKEYNFEDISFKMPSDYKFEELDEKQAGTYSSKKAMVTLDDDIKISIQYQKYDDLSTSSEIIEEYESILFEDFDSIVKNKNVTINDIEMHNAEYIHTRGVDPLECDCSESYYFVSEDKLYVLRVGSYTNVSKNDFTDDKKQELFEAKAFDELEKIVNTVELN